MRREISLTSVSKGWFKGHKCAQEWGMWVLIMGEKSWQNAKIEVLSEKKRNSGDYYENSESNVS